MDYVRLENGQHEMNIPFFNDVGKVNARMLLYGQGLKMKNVTPDQTITLNFNKH